MTPDNFLLLALLGTAAGALIGCVGIGGVVLVPALAYGFGVPLPTAVAAALLAFLISGVVGTLTFARRGSIRWHIAWWIFAGAMPAAFLGALAVHRVPVWIIEASIGLLAAASGAHALLARRPASAAVPPPVRRPQLVATGAITGFASALTGTGGPLVLIPLLVAMKVPTLAAIGLGQAVQLPVAGFATAGSVIADAFPLALGVPIGAGIAVGTFAGAQAAHALPIAWLRRVVSALLVVVGAGLLARLWLQAAP